MLSAPFVLSTRSQMLAIPVTSRFSNADIGLAAFFFNQLFVRGPNKQSRVGCIVDCSFHARASLDVFGRQKMPNFFFFSVSAVTSVSAVRTSAAKVAVAECRRKSCSP
jgi:hypothetical protein